MLNACASCRGCDIGDVRVIDAENGIYMICSPGRGGCLVERWLWQSGQKRECGVPIATKVAVGYAPCAIACASKVRACVLVVSALPCIYLPFHGHGPMQHPRFRALGRILVRSSQSSDLNERSRATQTGIEARKARGRTPA